MMKARNSIFLFWLVAGAIIVSSGPAQAANGTLQVSFRYTDPATSAVQNLVYGYIYLRNAANPAPMEKFFSKADYILGGPAANHNDGNYTVSVPAGNYYIRLTQRKVVSGALRPYGPPEAGDLTWFQTTPITITAGATLNLGTVNANPFGSTITITGTVKNYSGTPLAGRMVRAQVVPCYTDGYNGNVNQCGPVKLMALLPTDANGKYMLQLRDPGTYYLYTFSSWDQNANYNPPAIAGTPYPSYTIGPQPLTVKSGDNITAEIVTY